MNTEVPPHDLDAELAFLGAILISGDATLSTIPAEAFYSAQHRDIYEAVQEASSSGEPIDALTVGKRVPNLRSLIVEAQDKCALPSHAQHYADIILNAARLRSVERVARLLVAKTHEDDADADTIESEAAAAFLRTQHPAGASALSLHDLVEREIDALERPQEYVDVPGMRGIALYGGDVMVVGGRPGHGKSAFGLWLALEWSRRYRTCFFSYEMGESQTGRRLISRFSGLSLTDLNIGFSGSDAGTVRALIGDALENRDFSYKVCGGMPTKSLFASLRRFAAGGGRVAIIDYLQLAARARSGTMREDVTVFTNELKQIALATGLVIVALSQLKRPDDERALRPPTASELRESGSIEQDADTILLMMTLPSLRRDEKALDLAQKALIGYRTGASELEVGDDPDDDLRLTMLDAVKVRQGRLMRRPFIFDGASMNFTPCERSTGTVGAF